MYSECCSQNFLKSDLISVNSRRVCIKLKELFGQTQKKIQILFGKSSAAFKLIVHPIRKIRFNIWLNRFFHSARLVFVYSYNCRLPKKNVLLSIPLIKLLQRKMIQWTVVVRDLLGMLEKKKLINYIYVFRFILFFYNSIHY